MKKYTYMLLVLVLIPTLNSCIKNSEPDWNFKEGPLTTQWAKEIDISKPWNQYPRPAMLRDDWVNLNGLWDFAICDKESKPEVWDKQILVPYPVESALSGIMERVNENQVLWYRKELKIPSLWKNKRVLFNFEASDWETNLFVNGKLAGTHKGGYDPFTIDISDYLKKGKQEIMISVWDPTEKGTQARGKQVSDPHGIWYTPSSGIWQTVWMEPVEQCYIKSFKITNDIDKGLIAIEPEIYNLKDGLSFRIKVFDNDKLIAENTADASDRIETKLSDYDLWSPNNPKLYKLEIELFLEDKIYDRLSSYTGFRKVSLGLTADGFTRILLNNEFVFQNGPLDQGFWPDGLYTPPSDQAMLYDIEATKRMGFNMLRKHVKVENRRFYSYCDKLGILVWQDLPSGDKYIHGDDPDIEKSDKDEKQFKTELAAMINSKYNNPSIIIWVPYNEGWGQYKTEEISDFVKDLDPGRLVNSASGWTDRGTGDILDIHHYPDPRMPEPEVERAIVLGEFGGLGLPVQDHTWEKKNWGYKTMDSKEELLEKYETYYQQIFEFIKAGLSAVVYTQTTDVETETNGLLTYDRFLIKMGADSVARINKEISTKTEELFTAQKNN